MQKKKRTSTLGVSIAALAIGLWAIVFTGCEKKADTSPPPPHSPESYMNDSVFRGKLTAARLEHQKLARSRNEIARKMKAKAEAMKEKLGTGDLKLIEAELAKDAEWNDLNKQCAEADAKLAAQRKKTLGEVRERLTPKKQISK